LTSILFFGNGPRYQGSHATKAAAESGSWIIEIAEDNELHIFVVLPKRWIVERTIA